MRIKYSKMELLDKFNEQLIKLKTLCELYDNGDIHFAQEIAVKLRLLFHNTKHSQSLFHQLKINNLSFIDTAQPYDSKSLISHLGLTKMQLLRNNNGHIPLGMKKIFRNVEFDHWWDGKEIIVDQRKNVFTRRKIILEVSNTDGGAHIDSLMEDYFSLSRKNSTGWFIKLKSSEAQLPFNDPTPPTIRQIANEVSHTFENLDLEKLSNL